MAVARIKIQPRIASAIKWIEKFAGDLGSNSS